MEPGHLYTNLDAAVHAACCLSSLHPAGATVYYRVTAENNEEYMITSEAVHADGNGWQLEGANWHECYTITSPTGAGILTGSRAADMLSTIKSGEAAARRDYRLQLATERLTGQPQDDSGFVSAAMQRGIDMEPMALAAYESVMSIDDPINDPENEDMSEVEMCRHCVRPIQPGAELQWNGWSWHSYCAPLHVLWERDEERRHE